MALIVEDGSGVAGAESLTSVAFFRDYHAKRGNVTAAGLSDELIEQLLRKATDYAVAMYAGQWGGNELYVGQPLPFPRSTWGPVVPLVVQQAIAELALIARATPLMPNITKGKKKVKVGPVEVEYDSNAPTSPNFVAASLRFAAFFSNAASGGIFAKLVRT